MQSAINQAFNITPVPLPQEEDMRKMLPANKPIEQPPKVSGRCWCRSQPVLGLEFWILIGLAVVSVRVIGLMAPKSSSDRSLTANND